MVWELLAGACIGSGLALLTIVCVRRWIGSRSKPVERPKTMLELKAELDEEWRKMGAQLGQTLELELQKLVSFFNGVASHTNKDGASVPGVSPPESEAKPDRDSWTLPKRR